MILFKDSGLVKEEDRVVSKVVYMCERLINKDVDLSNHG
jgi:hypothetical protein